MAGPGNLEGLFQPIDIEKRALEPKKFMKLDSVYAVCRSQIRSVALVQCQECGERARASTAALAVDGKLVAGSFALLQTSSAAGNFQPPLFDCYYP